MKVIISNFGVEHSMNASGDALDELVEFILKINGGLKQGQDYYPLFDHFDCALPLPCFIIRNSMKISR